jgi:broad specificity phosphatase PhoE
MKKNHLYLIRHGENAANLTQQFSHRKVDFPLNAKGILQAQQTAVVFTDKAIHEIYASPLKRAAETAQIIGDALGLTVKIIEDFRELNVGDLEGQPPSEALWEQHNGIIAGWMKGRPEVCFPGGENYFGLLGRMRSGLEQVLAGKEGRSIIIVGHGGMFTCTIKELCMGAPGFLGSMDNCAISEIEASLTNGEQGGLAARLISYASAGHLSGEAARLVSGMPDTPKASEKA